MFPAVQHRLVHYVLLIGVVAVTTFPNLGAHSLWDVDEGVNAEAAREMYEKGTWLVPTFNYELRTAKPVLLYWFQHTSYLIFGVNEFSARLPSVLAAMVTVLLTYELARRMFGVLTGLLAGAVLAGCLEFCILAHAATPDSTLLMFTMLTFYLFWIGAENGGRWWFVPTATAVGFAVLTKGPIGIALPGLIILLYFLWNREVRRMWDRRFLWGGLAFLLVAAPWYILITVETRGVFTGKFFGRENVGRFLQPMEHHSGPILYHVIGILLLFTPWSLFILGTLWDAWKKARRIEPTAHTVPPEQAPNRPYRLLWAWLLVYVVFFSLAATKLPNYVLPVYPVLAILTARFLTRWYEGGLVLPRWWMPVAIICLAMVGVLTALGLLIVGGALPIPYEKMRLLPGLERWWFIGVIPVVGAAVAGFLLWNQRRGAMLVTMAVSGLAYVGTIAAFPVVAFEQYKAPRSLIVDANACRPQEEIRLASYGWYAPSVVFYAQREVKRLQTFDEVTELLQMRLPVYVFMMEEAWQIESERRPELVRYRIAARRYDYLKHSHVLVVTNQ